MIKELFPPVEPKADTPRFVPANGSPANCGGGSQKALVLTANKWKQLLSTATGGPSRRPETAHTVSLSRHKQYLKEESQAMTRKWENTVQNIREKKEAERVRKQLERVTEGSRLCLTVAVRTAAMGTLSMPVNHHVFTFFHLKFLRRKTLS